MAEGVAGAAAGWRPYTWSKVTFKEMTERNRSKSKLLDQPHQSTGLFKLLVILIFRGDIAGCTI